MPSIKFLTFDIILITNRCVELQANKNDTMGYENRFVPKQKKMNLLKLLFCTEKYFEETNDIILTAAYYLKNIIVLQSLEDGNHRTALAVTNIFLNDNGYNTKSVSTEQYLEFKNDLLMYRRKEYYTFGMLGSNVLNFKENITDDEENYTFNYCLLFIKNKMLR